jgi:methionine sulfoxide reductase heme-binding subunit
MKCESKLLFYEKLLDFCRFGCGGDYYLDAFGVIVLPLMRRGLLEKIDLLVVFCFYLHDFASDLLTRYLFLIKRLLLVTAYVSLLGVLFPELRRGFGSLAQAILFLIIFLSPLSKILRMRLLNQLMGLRREFGILMGCFALVHGVAYFIDPTSYFLNIAPYLNVRFFSMPPLFSFGVLSLILTLVLFFTSNNFSVRLLGGKKWKILHRVVYLLLLTVLLHILFVQSVRRGYNTVSLIKPVGIILSYVLLKLLAWKNFLPPLRSLIARIGERYTAFVLVRSEEARQSVA